MTGRTTNSENGTGPSTDQHPVYVRSGDLEAIQKRGRNFRPPMTAADLLKYHLHQSLLGRIESGTYSPRRLILEVGQDERGDKNVGSARDREEYDVRMQGWDRVVEAAARVNEDLLFWIGQVAEIGTALPSPVRRCTPETIIRAAGREIAGQTEVFSRGRGPLACELRPGPSP